LVQWACHAIGNRLRVALWVAARWILYPQAMAERATIQSVGAHLNEKPAFAFAPRADHDHVQELAPMVVTES
jgi:hypothetical protein